VGRSRGFATPADVACGREAGNWSETLLSAIMSLATDSKDNLSKDFRERDMITPVFASFFCVGSADWIMPANRL